MERLAGLRLPGIAVVALVIGAISPATASATATTTYAITTTTDAPLAAGAGTDCVSTLPGGPCTLRAAVQAADSFAGIATIQVPAGTYALTIKPAGTDDGSSGDLNIANTNGKTIVKGTGVGQTVIDANETDRAFDIGSGATAEIDGVTIEHGNPGQLPGAACPSTPDTTTAPGGAIRSAGTLTLSGDAIVDSIADGGGGGVDDMNATGPLTITGSTISNDTSCSTNPPQSFAQADLGNGGGVDEAGAPSVTITDSTFAHDSAVDHGTLGVDGGGLAVDDGSDGTVTLLGDTLNDDSAISDNGSVSYGGGAVLGVQGDSYPADTASVVDTTVTGNSAQRGGGITSLLSTTVSFSTIADNTATSDGDGDNLETFVEVGGSFTLDDSIIVGGDASNPNCGPFPFVYTDTGHNLFDGDGTACDGLSAGDVVNADPKLGPLADNGGPTQTMALQAASPAIDAGDNSVCASETGGTDQRGVARPQGAACDIGAYEYGGADLALTASAARSTIPVGDSDTITDTVSNSGPTFATGVTLTDPAPAGFRVDSASPSQGTCTHTASSVSCKLGTLAKGAQATVQIVVTAISAGTLPLHSSASMDQADPTPGDDTAQVTVTVSEPEPARPTPTPANPAHPQPAPTPAVSPRADLALRVTASRSAVSVGRRLLLRLTITDRGPSADARVTIVDRLPRSLTLVSEPHACHGRRVIRCSLGSLRVGADRSVTLRVRARRAGSVRDRADATGAVTDPDVRNNRASVRVRVRPLPSCGALVLNDRIDSDDLVPTVQVYIDGRLVRTLHGHNLRQLTLTGPAGMRSFRLRVVFRADDLRNAIATARVRGCHMGAVSWQWLALPGALDED